MSLISLQGSIRIGTRLVTGKPGAMFFVGDAPEATINLATESETIKESFTGKRLPYGTIDTGQSGTFNVTLNEWLVKNMALGLHSVPLPITPAPVVDELLPTGLAVGDQVKLDHPYVTAPGVTLEDSTGSPVTVDTDDYRLIGHNRSVIEILNLTGYTQPLKASYAYEAYTGLEVFSAPSPERYVLFDGINTVNNEPVLVEIYRAKFSPIQNLGLINAGVGTLPLVAEILFDPLNVDSNGLGGFFKVIQKTAA